MRAYFTLILLILSALLFSVTYTVEQDGSGNFTSIQEGIIAATDNDTILVYPGIYYENIDYLEKSLTIASLYLITQEDSIINQTIIDGNNQARCVKIKDCENSSLIGFTIQNGSAVLDEVYLGYQGGGIYLKDSANSLISNCKIKNNEAITGGAICMSYSNVEFKKNTISHNRGILYGGGISILGANCNFEFSEDHLNNIYENYSSTGSDLYIIIPATNFSPIVLDTFTVAEPDYFFIESSFDYTFSCLNAKIEEVDNDLYVAPNGNDSNNGLSFEEPLQTIAWAQTLIKRNNETPHTIFLAPGIYSPSLNNQIFPLNVKYGVCYSGVSPEETIWDAENESPFFYQLSRFQTEFSKLVMENIKLTNGEWTDYSGGITIYQSDIDLTNVVIENCIGDVSGAIMTNNGFCNLNNVEIRNNIGVKALYLFVEYNCPNPVIGAKIMNTVIQDNQPNIDPDFCDGGGLNISGHPNIEGDYYANLINSEISENHSAFYNPQIDMGGTSGLSLGDMVLVNVVNSTFGDNTLSHNTGCTISVDNSELNFYNSIIYDNDGHTFNLWENAMVNLSHSLMEGGNGNINYYYPLAIVNWEGGNINADPLFDTNGEYPFQLSEFSPCIDAGTMDLPDGIELPEYDLAGNPRIVGNSVDIGAYEYQGASTHQNEIPMPAVSSLNVYPNPFMINSPRKTELKFELKLIKDGNIKLEIYNVKGQKVKTIMDAFASQGKYLSKWDGKNNQNKFIATGTYFARFTLDDKVMQVRKFIIVK